MVQGPFALINNSAYLVNCLLDLRLTKIKEENVTVKWTEKYIDEKHLHHIHDDKLTGISKLRMQTFNWSFGNECKVKIMKLECNSTFREKHFLVQRNTQRMEIVIKIITKKHWIKIFILFSLRLQFCLVFNSTICKYFGLFWKYYTIFLMLQPAKIEVFIIFSAVPF